MEKIIVKNGIVIEDTSIDETGRFPVGPDYYKGCEKLVWNDRQKLALKLYRTALLTLVEECRDDEFATMIDQSGWFGKDILETVNEIAKELLP
ncbi:hypothetical protein D3C75_333130 [compost metagenome]